MDVVSVSPTRVERWIVGASIYARCVPVQLRVPSHTAHERFTEYAALATRLLSAVSSLGTASHATSDRELGDELAAFHRQGVTLLTTVLATGVHSLTLDQALRGPHVEEELCHLSARITELRRSESNRTIDRNGFAAGLAALSNAAQRRITSIINACQSILAALEDTSDFAARPKPGPRTILFLASNPSDTPQLELAAEAREIEEKLRLAEHRDAFTFKTRWAVRTDDLIQALNQDRPTIVHFSGHGSGVTGLVLQDSNNTEKLVSTSALKRLFNTLKDDIRVVVLNACFSVEQADAIAQVIDCVIGMNDTIGDVSARNFAASFYRALAFGRSVQNAFDQGVASIELDDLQDEMVPKLIVRPGVDASHIVLAGATH